MWIGKLEKLPSKINSLPEINLCMLTFFTGIRNCSLTKLEEIISTVDLFKSDFLSDRFFWSNFAC